MCTTCGCDSGQNFSIQSVGHQDAGHAHHHHHHGLEYHHNHEHSHAQHGFQHEYTHTHSVAEQSRQQQFEVDILSANDKLAERNRGYFEAKGLMAINLVSSPGSSKATLLEKTLQHLRQPAYVIEGDQ